MNPLLVRLLRDLYMLLISIIILNLYLHKVPLHGVSRHNRNIFTCILAVVAASMFVIYDIMQLIKSKKK